MILQVSLVVILISSFASSQGFSNRPLAFNLSIGSSCILNNNNDQGYCEEYVQCEYAQLLYSIRKLSEIKFCGIKGTQSVVCCPSIPKVSNQLVGVKVTKFQNSLCKSDQTIEINDNPLSTRVNAEIGEFPFQAAIGYKSEDGKSLNFYCGGSLIADDIVLTAAGCVNRRHRVPIMVRLGRVSKILPKKVQSHWYTKFYLIL